MKMKRGRSAVLSIAAVVAASTALPAPAAGQQRDAVEIPLELRSGRMVVPVHTPDGEELEFLVSTGSAVTVLSRSGAEKIGDRAVTLGGLPVSTENAHIVDDASLTVDGVVMDGLVGNNTLNQSDNLFDAPGGRLVLKPTGRSVEWPGMTLSEPVPLRIYHGVVASLDVAVDGTEYPAMLELGAQALLANEAVLSETGITDGTATLSLGATDFTDVPIEASDHPTLGRFSPNGDGFVIVGAPPLWRCAISLSWVHRELRTCVR
jgi:hypothetical protein